MGYARVSRSTAEVGKSALHLGHDGRLQGDSRWLACEIILIDISLLYNPLPTTYEVLQISVCYN